MKKLNSISILSFDEGFHVIAKDSYDSGGVNQRADPNRADYCTRVTSYYQLESGLFKAEHWFKSNIPFFDTIKYSLTNFDELFTGKDYTQMVGIRLIGSKKPDSFINLLISYPYGNIPEFMEGYEPVFEDEKMGDTTALSWTKKIVRSERVQNGHIRIQSIRNEYS